MRKLLALLIFVLFLCLANQSEARKLALLVGVDDYVNVSPLKCCVNDMKTLKTALMKIGFEENDIQILTTGGSLRELPRKERIESEVKDILSAARDSDMIFIAFSGHGRREGDTDYFCPPFADPEDIPGTCVSIPQVMEDLGNCRAKFKWMVVDACRDMVGSRDSSKSFEVISAAPAGIALFQSCSKGERSYEETTTDAGDGNGYFTKNLAAALSGDEADANRDGKLTLMEVVQWTMTQTKSDVKKEQNKKQTPYFTGEYSDFPLTEDLNFPKAEALAKEAQAAMNAKNYSLALTKFDAAIALCPRIEAWKQQRKWAKDFIDNPVTPTPPQPTPAPAPAPPTSRTAGERMVLTVDGIEYAFRWAPPGEFMMGSPESEPDRDSDEKQHRVTLTQGFWLLETEVTQEMWESVMGKNPSRFKGSRNPVECVSWNDSQEFCRKLGQKMGRKIKLPTEAQWEYACRAGTTRSYAGTGNLDSMGWYDKNSGSKPHAVKQKKPNAWGLYDMHGNVWEWCADTLTHLITTSR